MTWSHVVLGVEILIGLLVLNRNVKRHISRITIEFNGKDKGKEDGRGV